MKKFLSFISVILLAFMLVACGSKEDPDKKQDDPEQKDDPIVYEISISEEYKNVEIEEGKDVTVTATVTNNGTVTWTTGNANVATVENGKITGVKAGSTTITATVKEDVTKKVDIQVTVKEPEAPEPTTYVLTIEGDATVTLGQTAVLMPSLNPDLNGAKFTWTSDNEKIITVDETGKIKGVKYGTATITCLLVREDGGEKTEATISITVVTPAVTKVTVSGDTSVATGNTIELSYALEPSKAKATVTWSSADETIATVDADGKVTGHKAGTVTITCTAKQDDLGVEIKKEYEITVTEPNPTSCTVTGSASTVAIGGTVDFTAVLGPTGCNDAKTWSVDHPYLASIDATGKLTAIAAGVVEVKCTTADENVYGVATVTIEAPAVTQVKLYGSTQVQVGETFAFRAVAISTQNEQKFTWSSSDDAILTVDANGNVTGVSAGTAKVIATYPGTTIKDEIDVTVVNAITYTKTIVIDPSLTETTAGTVIGVEEVNYTFGTDIFASLSSANITDNTKVILMQGEYGAYELTASNVMITECVDNVANINGIFTIGNGVHDLIVDGVTITGQILGTTNNTNITFQNCTVDQAAEGTFYFDGNITNFKLSSCNFVNVKSWRSVRFEANCVLTNFICEDCLFEGTGNYDYIRSIAGSVCQGVITIKNCKFVNSSQSGIQFAQMGSAYFEVVGCEFYDMKNTAVDLRINKSGTYATYYNISYNIFDNSNIDPDADATWGCIRLRFNNYSNDTIKVDCNYNKFINWNDGNCEFLFDNASQSSESGYFEYKLCNFENNYITYDVVNNATFSDSACKYSVISAEAVDNAIALFNLNNTDDTVKLVGTSADYTKTKYATLTAALADAQSGDIIYLLPGTYNENVTISTDNITIRSLLFGNAATKDMATNEKAAKFTGKITLASKLKGLTIDGVYFTDNAQIINNVGVAGTATDPDTNLDVFNFINNLVETKLASGKGFIYFVEESSSYSHNINFTGNYFDGNGSGVEAIVYIDNVYDLNVAHNVFANATGKGLYINDKDKGLSGQYDVIVSNKFINCANGLWINWLSPLPNTSETGQVYIVNNEFENISAVALYVGRMNNVDIYTFFNVQFNKFTSVYTAINFDRVTTSCGLNANYNIFTNVPTNAYYISGQISSATLGSIDASFNVFMDGNGNYIEPDASKFSITSAETAPIILDNRVESEDDLTEFVEYADDIEIFEPENLYAGESQEVDICFYPTDTFNKNVTYTVEDPTILTIENGIINPLKAGTTKITAVYDADSTIRYEVEFTVKEYNVLELRYEGNGILKATETVQVSATVENAGESTNLVWTTSDANIATVSNTGLVTAVGKGNVTITCKIDGVQKQATVGFSVVDSDLEANALLKLLVEANNGTIMYEKINYIGYESGFESVAHYVYGSANKYYAGTNPSITQYLIPTTNTNTRFEERTCGVQLICVHDTGAASPSSNALANAKWCTSSGNTNSSWHYTVGNDGIYQQLDDKYVAWHAGDGSETPTGQVDTGVVATEPGKRATVTIDDGYFVVNGTKTTILAPKGSDGETLTTDDIVDSGIVTIIGENNHYYIGAYYNSTYKKIASYGGYGSIGIETAVNKGSDVYLTWQRTAKLVASKLVQYDLTLDRLVYHNNLSGKNCPQTMRTANKCDMFEDMVAIEYEIAKNYSDWTITFTSSNTEVLDNTGRVVGNGPRETTQVNYTITVTKGEVTASQVCSVLVIGTRNAN